MFFDLLHVEPTTASCTCKFMLVNRLTLTSGLKHALHIPLDVQRNKVAKSKGMLKSYLTDFILCPCLCYRP